MRAGRRRRTRCGSDCVTQSTLHRSACPPIWHSSAMSCWPGLPPDPREREEAVVSWRSTCSRPTRSRRTHSKPRRRRNPSMRLDGQGLLVLVDPVRTDGAAAARIGRAAKAAGVRGFLIGSSFDGAARTHEVARALRDSAPGVPVALFPGSAMQLTDQVDLVLFLSLVSGRNPQYLIEEHVRAVPFLQRHPVATLSTAYILIDGGRVTSVEAVSGAERPVPENVIRACRAAVPDRLLFVGGGIRTPEQARAARAAGADF